MQKLTWQLSGLTLFSCTAIFAGCSITEKEAQLPPVVRAERQLAKAEKIRSNPSEKVAKILSVASAVTTEIRKASREADMQQPVRIYNRAAVDLASELPRLPSSPTSFTIQNRHTGEIYRLRLGPADRAEYSPAFFQELLDARKLQVRRGEQAVVNPGLGGTLVGVHRSVLAGSQLPRFEPASGYRVPVTAIIDFSGGSNEGPVEARLRLVNPLHRNTVEIGGHRFPLAANFSAPLLSYGRLNELWLGFINMIRGENMRNAAGLLLIEPYDPDRIPVIFVHGLLSSRYVWRKTALALLQDPEIRRRYQFWAYSYPTGNPISSSALNLREDLALAQKRFLLKDGIVLIGHSMGGLLSRMQVTNSGRTIWDEVFGSRAQELYLQVPNDARVKRALIFQANPTIRRVIFVATPHRGSRLAVGGIGAIAIWLIRLPLDLLHEIPEAIADALSLKNKRTTVPTSIHGLSPNSPLLHALDRLPIQAVHHSIIGDRGRGDTPNSSDGVVPYWSSHLPSAQSEKIVPTGHDAMDDPQAIEELRRILLLNLGIREDRPSAGMKVEFFRYQGGIRTRETANSLDKASSSQD
ncbi:MAG: alpha/beta fold hydrolase [Verrucomicrobia bacterium]|nr:alpha/beta fold hydrolase [Verrucomicrobiota bacterium]